MGKIVQDGFVSEYSYEPHKGDYDRIYFPVTGHFVMVEGKPETMKLYDDFARVFHRLENVSFLWPVSSQLEGKKKFPRPFIMKQVDGDTQGLGTQLVSAGEKVKISYIGGELANPLVEGAIENLVILNQHQFLRLDGANLDRQAERYENDDYFLEYENNGHGEFTTRIVAQGQGTGNITLDLTGLEGAGNVTLRLNGTLSLVQVDKDGNPVQSLTIDKAEGVRVQAQKDGKQEHQVYGETLQGKLADLIAAIRALTVPTPSGVSGIPNNAADFKKIADALDEILTR
jgi:hypothetical protein